MVGKVCASGTAIGVRMMSRQAASLVSCCQRRHCISGSGLEVEQGQSTSSVGVKARLLETRMQILWIRRSKFCNENGIEELRPARLSWTRLKSAPSA